MTPRTSTPPDFDDAPDTGTISANLRASIDSAPATGPVTQAQHAVVARALAKILDGQQYQRGERAAEARGRTVWRAMGSTAAAVALSIAGYAVSLASQASADHQRLDRVEAAVRDNAEAIAANVAAERTRSDDLLSRGLQLQGVVGRTEAIVDRIETGLGARIDSLDARLTTLERAERRR